MAIAVTPEMVLALGSSIAALLTATGTFVLSIHQSRKTKTETRRLTLGIEAVNSQVTNGHSSNLREDLSEVKQIVERVEKRQFEMAEEVREERRRLTRIDEQAERTHGEIFQRLRSLEGPRRFKTRKDG